MLQFKEKILLFELILSQFIQTQICWRKNKCFVYFHARILIFTSSTHYDETLTQTSC